jgi:predicted permease
MGRAFTETEELPHGGRVVVLSNELWRRRFQSDPRIIGKSISAGGQLYDVIGVLSPRFSRESFPLVWGVSRPPDLWIPLQLNAGSTDYNTYFEVAGRLKSGVTLSVANAELSAAAAGYRRLNPRDTSLGSKGSFGVQALREFLNQGAISTLFLLFGAVAFVLLIACANVASLQLARSTARRQEFAVRAAHGARRGRVVRQLLIESWLLAAGGCTLGVLVGFAGIYAAVRIGFSEIAGLSRYGSAVTIDWRLLLFTLLVSFSTAILFGIFPALQGSRVDVSETLKESGGRIGAGFRQNKVRSALVVCEMALALVLSIGAGLLVRTFVALHTAKSGLNAHNVLTLHMVLSGTRFQKTSGVSDTVQTSLDRLANLPGVLSAGFTCCLPLEGVEPEGSINLVGRSPDAASSAVVNTVSPDYFHVFEIPLMNGRTFTESDNAGSTPVVIINERLAHQFWPNTTTLQAPLNAQIRILDTPNLPPWQVVGVVGDVRAYGLTINPPPIFYIPVAQTPEDLNTYLVRNTMSWIVRARTDPSLISLPVQNMLRQATGGLPVLSVQSMDEIVRQSAGSQDSNLLLMSILALSALLLAAIGIYGLISYSVEARTHEIGIRMAMGAQRRDVYRLIAGHGMMLASFGVLIGAAGALFLTRFLTHWLYGVEPTDALTFVAVSLFLMAVSLVACSIPARRATKADPMAALRCE